MKKYKKYGIIATGGGIYYFLLEILWRGYSHWSMILLGGVCISMICFLSERLSEKSLIIKSFAGCLIITAAEFAVGVGVNILLGWDVWDYSDKAFNLMGQICLSASVMWFALCVPGFVCMDIIRRIVDERDK